MKQCANLIDLVQKIVLIQNNELRSVLTQSGLVHYRYIQRTPTTPSVLNMASLDRTGRLWQVTVEQSEIARCVNLASGQGYARGGGIMRRARRHAWPLPIL